MAKQGSAASTQKARRTEPVASWRDVCLHLRCRTLYVNAESFYRHVVE